MEGVKELEEDEKNAKERKDTITEPLEKSVKFEDQNEISDFHGTIDTFRD